MAGEAAAPVPVLSGPAPVSVYVHWPYCESKCPYCDFNSHVADRVDHRRWRRALLDEFGHLAGRLGERRLVSIFFGGGTPSLMPPDLVAELVDRITGFWPGDSGGGDEPEISLEANPGSVEAGRFAAYRRAGINRVSLGVQALDDAALAFLGRRHSAAEALAALETARTHFECVSFDLIYARPGQTVAAWRRELARAAGLASGHLSLYQLTIEANTPFARDFAAGRLRVPDPEQAGRLYELTQALLAEAGLPAYEISNHAAPGQECRHNLVYWRRGDYLGIGPGAHGRFRRDDGGAEATETVRAPNAWLRMVERDGHGVRRRQRIGRRQRLAECLMMGLRLVEGVPVARLRAEGGAAADRLLASPAAAALADAGYLTLTPARIRATADGRQRLDGVLRHLLAAIPDPTRADPTAQDSGSANPAGAGSISCGADPSSSNTASPR